MLSIVYDLGKRKCIKRNGRIHTILLDISVVICSEKTIELCPRFANSYQVTFSRISRFKISYISNLLLLAKFNFPIWFDRQQFGSFSRRNRKVIYKFSTKFTHLSDGTGCFLLRWNLKNCRKSETKNRRARACAAEGNSRFWKGRKNLMKSSKTPYLEVWIWRFC